MIVKSNAPKVNKVVFLKSKAKELVARPSLIVKLPLGALCWTPIAMREGEGLSRETRGGRKIKLLMRYF